MRFLISKGVIDNESEESETIHKFLELYEQNQTLVTEEKSNTLREEGSSHQKRSTKKQGIIGN